jgi:hypothetical protein
MFAVVGVVAVAVVVAAVVVVVVVAVEVSGMRSTMESFGMNC